MKIILGSQSEGRKQVLEEAGFHFSVMHSNIDEKTVRNPDPNKQTLAIARAKAQALLPSLTEEALLITGDHVVVHNGIVREKPSTIEEARHFLQSYSGSCAVNISAVVVTNTGSKKQVEGVDTATVFFREIPVNVIDSILAERKVLSAAGGFIVQDPLLTPYIERIEGEIDTVIGLPLALTKLLLRDATLLE